MSRRRSGLSDPGTQAANIGTNRIVKIYLLSIDERRYFFYADAPEASEEEGGAESAGESSPGFWGRLHDRTQQWKSAWDHSDSRSARWTRRAWDWLHSWSHPDELMLARLWRARSIDLNHPASRPGAEVRALWAEYLNHRWWRHLLWMSVNAVVAPFTVLFALLPGPNVIGYWFAYRAVHHALIVWGIRRVRRGQARVELHPVPSLDRAIERDERGKAMHDALDGSAALLDEHVAWTESETTDAVSGGDRPRDTAAGSPADRGSETHRDGR